ncbi:MAG: N-acetylneuraminate synthase family protein, partial [Candidatus Omnitrophica bacterium]|nr:N-acetylneuraminate synthase family protein [Candidatus Omnitrophota bacterium]
MTVGNVKNKTFIIAEAGVNHNGTLKTARKMIDAAVYAGADAVKFQTFRAENVVSITAPKAEYQKRRTNTTESQLEMLRRFELDLAAHKELIKYCRKKGIMFLSTPFDAESIAMLNELGLKIFKIP